MIRKFNKYHIYSDTKEALGIIDLWSNYHINYLKKEKLYDSLHRWVRIPKKIRDSVGDKVPFWLSSKLREEFPEGIEKLTGKKESFVGLAEKNIIFAMFPDDAWDNREMFEEYCDDFHVYGKNKRQDLWDNHIRMVDRLKKPPKEKKNEKVKLDTDFRMKEKYGWLSRGGTYFPCGFALHDSAAKQICINQEWDLTNPPKTLEDKGWVRIHKVEGENDLFFSHTKPLSADQKKKIERYCVVHDVIYHNSK